MEQYRFIEPYLPNRKLLGSIDYSLPSVLNDVCPYNFVGKEVPRVFLGEEAEKRIYAFPTYAFFVLGLNGDNLPELYLQCAELCASYLNAALRKFLRMHGEIIVKIDDAIFVAREKDRDRWERILKEIGRPIARYYGPHFGFYDNVAEFRKHYGRHIENYERLWWYMRHNNLAMRFKPGFLGKKIEFFRWNNYTRLLPVKDKTGKIVRWSPPSVS